LSVFFPITGGDFEEYKERLINCVEHNTVIATQAGQVISFHFPRGRAVDDLVGLMNQASLVEIKHGTASPQYAEVQRLRPVQERQARAWQEGHHIFDQLG
jgi:hypothetical protein